ncbi:hypothetical protein VCHA57P511_10700 [Vibrio chagasii]|nr:hypothetical protein VCHA57P511_10700 [Vibrio chagasii]
MQLLIYLEFGSIWYAILFKDKGIVSRKLAALLFSSTNSQEQQSEAPNNITRTTYRFSNDA